MHYTLAVHSGKVLSVVWRWEELSLEELRMPLYHRVKVFPGHFSSVWEGTAMSVPRAMLGCKVILSPLRSPSLCRWAPGPSVYLFSL